MGEGQGDGIINQLLQRGSKTAPSVVIGGEGGIRTLGTLLTYTHFPGVLLRPLGHLSSSTRQRRRSLLAPFAQLGAAAAAPAGEGGRFRPSLGYATLAHPCASGFEPSVRY
jgi:hypothetical protein